MKTRRLLSIIWLSVFAASPLFATPKPVTLSTASAALFVSYMAGPQTAGECVVLVHDWFGVSPFYTDAAETLSQMIDSNRLVFTTLSANQRLQRACTAMLSRRIS